MLVKKLDQNVNFAFVLGRLSKKIGNNFQYFPIDSWQNELKLGRKFGFDGVEWILSDLSNPIFNQKFIIDIKKELKKNKIIISSLAVDLIMSNPLYRMPKKKLNWIVEKLMFIQNQICIPRITIPIEETCRYKNLKQKNKTIQNLSYIIKNLSKKSEICIETDLGFDDLTNLLTNKKLKKLKLLIDIGNFRASGKNLKKFIEKFKLKIIAFHIKYRDKNYGVSKNIKKNFKELKMLKLEMKNLRYLKDLTFQTYRSDVDYLKDMKFNIKRFNEI